MSIIPHICRDALERAHTLLARLAAEPCLDPGNAACDCYVCESAREEPKQRAALSALDQAGY